MRAIFASIRTLFFGTLFLSLWTWFIPRWLVGARAYDDPRPAGFLLIAAGAAIVLPAMVMFAWRGLGTPAPFDPPRRLVVSGPYRFVRNPMYCGVAFVLLGEALAFPNLTNAMLATLLVFFTLVTAFVFLYEEPALRSKFGDEYADYCRHVGRWIPRFAPWYSDRHLE